MEDSFWKEQSTNVWTHTVEAGFKEARNSSCWRWKYKSGGHRLNYLICLKICSKTHRKISSFFAFNCHSARPNKNLRQNHGSTHEFPVNLSRVALDRYGNHVMQKLVEPGKPRAVFADHWDIPWTIGWLLTPFFGVDHWECKQQQTKNTWWFLRDFSRGDFTGDLRDLYTSNCWWIGARFEA